MDCNELLIARSNASVSMALDKKLLLEGDVKLAARTLANRDLRVSTDWYLKDPKTRNKEILLRAKQIAAEFDEVEIQKKHVELLANIFAGPLGMSPEVFRNKINLNDEKQMYVVIRPDLSKKDADKIMQLAHDYSVTYRHDRSHRYAYSKNGIFVFKDKQKRWYAMPDMASAIIGYVGEHEDDVLGRITGRAGIEKKMNHRLSGADGHVVTMGDKIQQMQPPVHGEDVQLTLDTGLQMILEEELDKGLNDYAAQKGTIILMNPSNGDILAMASRPTYNLNTRENIRENGYDFATQAIYEPGSTFKIISTAGALDQGLVEPDTKIFCEWGNFRNGSVKVPDHHPYGELSVEQILAKSSNIGSYKLALELREETFFDYIKAFGFGAKTNILMAGESAGVVNNTGNPTDFSRISYGYAVSVTPLQIACAYSAIANDGVLMRPRLLKSVMTENGEFKSLYKQEVVRRVIKQDTAEKMRRALTTVVDIKGTARRAKVEGFNVAGKTGTAHKIHPEGGYYNGKDEREKRYTVSFAGMMPAEKPEFVCVVVIDDPRGMPEPPEGLDKPRIGGGSVAAPIFAKVALRVAKQMGLQPTKLADEKSNAPDALEPRQNKGQYRKIIYTRKPSTR